MLVPNRHSEDIYRYGFQGQEKDDEIKGGKGNSLNYTFRMHDPRVGRFFAIDPLEKKYPHYTPYSFSGNKVIQFVELEGLEESGTNAGSVFMSLLFPLPPKIKNNPYRNPGAHGLSLAGKSAALAVSVPPLLVGAAYAVPEVGAAYGAYSTWYGTTATANYFAAGIGGTSSLAMADAGGYFGASIWQISGRKALFNGLANATGQIVYNNGLDNFNYTQPLFASAIGNPFLSNFGESSIFMGFNENGEFGIKANNIDSNFISTFGSNYLGSKMGAKFEAPSGIYKPARNILDFIGGGAVETFENKIGDDLKTIINTLSDFKIDKSFNRKKKTNDGF